MPGALALLAILLYLLLAGGSGDPRDQGGGPADGSSPAAAAASRPSGTVSARVVRVVDGDTIEVSIDGASDDVRYIGVDTPETVKPGDAGPVLRPAGLETSTTSWSTGGRCDSVFDASGATSTGGCSPTSTPGDRFVNAELVRGRLRADAEIEPNTSQRAISRRVERREPGEAGEGLWSAC